MDESPARLIAEQLAHLADKIEARLQRLEAEQAHQRQLNSERDAALRADLAALHRLLDDHESRLREATAGVTQFKMFAGLASGGSTVAALIALIRTWAG